jgi:hypothetical protein
MISLTDRGIPNGYGLHREAVGPNADHKFLLGFFMAEIIYTFIITLVKYSILALYWRIFGKETIRWPVWFLTAVVTSWGIAVVRPTAILRNHMLTF